MAGNREGGLIAAQRNKQRHGQDFYQRIGSAGGKKSRGGGFAKDSPCYCLSREGRHDRRQCAGLKGGAISRRGKAKKK